MRVLSLFLCFDATTIARTYIPSSKVAPLFLTSVWASQNSTVCIVFSPLRLLTVLSQVVAVCWFGSHWIWCTQRSGKRSLSVQVLILTKKIGHLLYTWLHIKAKSTTLREIKTPKQQKYMKIFLPFSFILFYIHWNWSGWHSKKLKKGSIQRKHLEPTFNPKSWSQSCVNDGKENMKRRKKKKKKKKGGRRRNKDCNIQEWEAF